MERTFQLKHCLYILTSYTQGKSQHLNVCLINNQQSIQPTINFNNDNVFDNDKVLIF